MKYERYEAFRADIEREAKTDMWPVVKKAESQLVCGQMEVKSEEDSGVSMFIEGKAYPMTGYAMFLLQDLTGTGSKMSVVASRGTTPKLPLNVVVQRYNEDVKLWKEFSSKQDMRILVREGKVQYVGAASYVPLPVDKLDEALIEGLGEHFPFSEFLGAWRDPAMTQVAYLPADDDLQVKIDEATGEEGRFEPVVQMYTSDIGLKTASVYPGLRDRTSGSVFNIGAAISQKHTGTSSVDNIKEAAKGLFKAFSDSADNLAALAKTEVTNPRGCLLNVGEQLLLRGNRVPVDVLLEKGDIFASALPFCTGLDIFQALQDIAAGASKSRKTSKTSGILRDLSIQEQIAKLTPALCKKWDYDSTLVKRGKK